LYIIELDCFAALPINVIRPDKMETATTVFNVNVSEENVDMKQATENDNAASNNPVNTEEAFKEEVKEAEVLSSDSPSGQKRTHETEDDDDDGKRKRRKGTKQHKYISNNNINQTVCSPGEDFKESKTRLGTNGRGKDRKSPNTVQTENIHNDSDEDKKSNEPKVPPLKIVLSNTNEVDTSVR